MNVVMASRSANELFKEAFASPVSESNPGTAMMIWFVIFGFILTVIAATWLAWLMYQDNKRHGPTARRLGAWLGLNRDELGLLRVVAAHAELPSAACLLISRGCFDAAAARASVQRGQRQRLRDIRKRIFEDE